MAEAAMVEERPAVPTRYYCHMCNVEINIPNTDYICPLCAGGFVEELPAAASSLTVSGEPSGSNSIANMSDSQRTSVINRINDLNALRGEIATLLLSRNAPNMEISVDPEHLPRRLPGSVAISIGAGTSGGGASGSNSGSTGGGRVRPQNLDRLDNVLLDFLQSLSGVDVETPYGNSEMFFLGNLGDYAWGREGIDTIVTQLLNQMETSGPPPLTKDKIAEIPKVEVTTEEVDRKLQCSVCWEDFRLHEIVRKLPCSHIYHENCIVPWLVLHGTCPICRKSLIENYDIEMDNNEAALPRNISEMTATGTTCPVHTTGATDTNGTGNNPSTSGTLRSTATTSVDERGTAATSQQQQQQQHHNVFGFDDGNVDLD